MCEDTPSASEEQHRQDGSEERNDSYSEANTFFEESGTAAPAEADHLENSSVAYSFNRPESEEGVENATHLQVNQTAGVEPSLTSTDLNAVANVMNTPNFQVISNPLQALNDRLSTENVEVCVVGLEALLGKDFSASNVSTLITSMLNVSANESTAGALIDTGPLSWNGKVLGAAIKRLAPNINWGEVVGCFDGHQYFNVRTLHALQFLTDIFTLDKQFPIEKLYTPWANNKNGQLSWLVQIATHPLVFNIFDYPHTLANIQCLKIMPDDSDRSLMIWRCLELVDVLFRLGENTGFSQMIFQLFRGLGPINKCPDVFGLVIVQLTSPLTQFRLYILKQVVVQLIANHANAVPVLNFVWNSDTNTEAIRTLVLNCFCDYYTSSDDQNRLTRILEVAHELKPNGLGELFNLPQYRFAIDLACLAARRDFLKLDKFLDDKLNEIGEPFAKHLCQYLKWRMTSKNTSLPVEIMQTVFTALQVRASYMPLVASELTQLIQQMRNPAPATSQFGQTPRPSSGANWMLPSQSNIPASRLSESSPMDFRPLGRENVLMPNAINMSALSGPFSADDDLSSAVFSEVTQQQANSYFQKIYDYQNPLSVQDFLWKMKTLSTSATPTDKELLSCLLKNLFDEFKFFAEYPEKELRTTAKVYGGIIREGIVVNMKFATAIRRIVEALQAPRSSLLNTFGMVALNECRACLYKYTKICQMVANLECFNWLGEELRDYITCGAQGNLPPFHSAMSMEQSGILGDNQRNTPQFMQPSSGMRFAARGLAGSSMMTVPSSEILMNAAKREGCTILPPDEKTVDSIKFLINNLSQMNLHKKVEEMKELMKPQDENFIAWLSQYFVISRITIESNLQNLYNNFFIALADENLNKQILRETYRNINTLLRGDKRQDVSSFGNRQLLKNLGFWLGSITIARNEPILYDDLNLKGILLDAFFRGQHDLLYVVPFVTKVLLATKQSLIFPPRSTWVYAILKVLAEIHNEPDLQLNLKFEIEVLCKELQIELRDIEIGSVLKDSSRLPSLYQPKGTPGRLESASPAQQNTGIPAAYNNEDPQRIIQQFIKRSETGVGGSNAFSGQTPDVQQQFIQQAIAAAQQKQSQQLPSFMQNHSQYNPLDSNSVNSNDTATQNENTVPSSAAMEIANNPNIKVILQLAQRNAIKDLLEGITNRAINVSIPATECLCKKDFAVTSDEKQLRRATHQMMRAMTAGMAAITCREPLLQSIQVYLKQALSNQMNFGQGEIPKQLEETVAQLAEMSIDQAVNYIVKHASDKAISSIDAAMENDYVIRTQCQAEGRQFKPDPSLISLNAKLPDALKISSNIINEEAFRVYDEFSKSTPSPDNISDEISESMRRVNAAFNTERASSTTNFDLLPRMQAPQNRLNSEKSILREWINMCHSQAANRDLQSSFAQVISFMQKLGLLSTDDTITKFFKTCTDICFDVAYRLLRNESNENTSFQARKQRCFFTLDSFVKLCRLMVKHSDDQNHLVKLNLLKKILNIMTQALITDHEQHREDFNGLPFMRIFLNLFDGLTGEDPALDPIAAEILECFGNTMIEIQPRRLPGFLFHWLEILGNRNFLARFFRGHTDLKSSRLQYIQMLILHLRYIGPFLRTVQINNQVMTIYKGTLRIVLVILHDFPEVLSEFHYVLCDVIQPNCIQLRNLILCACPREIGPHDMFSQGKEMLENLPIMNENPKLHHEMSNLLQPEILSRLDNYLRHRTAVDFLAELPSILMNKPSPGCKYNITTMNAIVICVGVKAIDSIHEKNMRICASTVANTAFMDVFQNLSVSLCTQGRYLLFNAITNQLRFPNSHTNYFSNILLYLFLQAHNNTVREQITRILLERLIVKKPHPWGLTMTFTELTKNKEYKFWNYDFVHSSPEIENWLKQHSYF
ncbi:hypothetical protein M3Y97_00821300 [Aphelenchoides bicaudatus]|nr:hypothetical protein M3Y97_00821300 [Aphelenchoides bicaudatus]